MVILYIKYLSNINIFIITKPDLEMGIIMVYEITKRCIGQLKNIQHKKNECLPIMAVRHYK